MQVPIEPEQDQVTPKVDSMKKEPSNQETISTQGEKNISMQNKTTISCYSSCCGSRQKVKK
jgi:hypothetical protein